MDLHLGVDGGQSPTTAVVGDRDGNVLGTGQGGPCNHARQSEGRAKLERGLTDAIGQALSPLQLTLASAKFVAVCIGMSGGPDDKRKIIHRLIRADAYDVTTDAHIALYGAVRRPSRCHRHRGHRLDCSQSRHNGPNLARGRLGGRLRRRRLRLRHRQAGATSQPAVRRGLGSRDQHASSLTERDGSKQRKRTTPSLVWRRVFS